MSARASARGLLAIAARETAERGALLGLALALAILPFVAPHIGIGDRPLLGGFLATVMVVAAALLTGSSVIARDVAEHRLGFFLARPLPWWSIWGGKVVAAVVLTLSAGAIVLAPSAAGGNWFLPAAGWWVAILLPAVLALIGGAHAVAVAYRSRSGWFAADLTLTLLCGWVVARTFVGLMQSGVDANRLSYISIALWILAAAVTAAGAVQVARGGTDVRRAHRVLSVVIWSVLLPSATAYAGWAEWARRPSPRDLASVLSAQAAGRSWVTVSGRVRWPRPANLTFAMLVDTASDRFLRLGAAMDTRGPIVMGTTAAWVTKAFSDDPRLLTADLSARHPSVTSRPLPIPPAAVFGFAVSPDGRTVAVVQSEGTTVFSIGSEQPLVAAPGRPAGSGAVAFSADGRAHVVVGPADRLQPGLRDLVTLDPVARRWTVTGRLETRGNPLERWGPRAERMAVLHRSDMRPSVTLHDGATGALLATLVREGDVGRAAATFLQDGRVAVVEAGNGVRLRLFTADGVEVTSVPIASSFAMARPVEIAPGFVAVELPGGGSARSSSSVIVDAGTGRVLRVEPGLRPAAAAGLLRETAVIPPSNLFIDRDGALVRVDPRSGAREAVFVRR